MDGTILNKKYDLVGRIKALEEGGGEEVVYLPGEGISIQEFEEGERTVSVKYNEGLALNENGQLYVNFTDYHPLLYSASNKTQIGVAVIGGNEYPVYRKLFTGITLPNNTTVRVDSGLTNEKILHLWGNSNNASGGYAPLPYSSPTTSWSIDLGYNYSTHKIEITSAIDYSNFTGDVIIEFVEIPTTHESKKKK